MRKNMTSIVMIAMSIIALTFVSCEKEEPLASTGNYRSGDLIMTDVEVKKGEIIDAYDYENVRMQFVGDELEDAFDHLTITNENTYRNSVSMRFNNFAKGCDQQYFEPKTENFSETKGAMTELKPVDIDHANGWVEHKTGSVYPWNATNNDDAADCPYSYRDSVWTSGSTFTFVPADSLTNRGVKGYEVNFVPVDVTVVEVEKKTEEVNGVVYNGKTWNALKVSYISTVTFTIPEEYRVKGGKYELTKEIINVVFYLRHEVQTTLEGLVYNVSILDGQSIYKDYQTVNFDLVTRDNGEVVEKKSYKLEENFSITASEVADVEVFSEEALQNSNVNFTKGNITPNEEAEDIFVKTNYNFTDNASMTDGRAIVLNGSYESYAWNSTVLPYATVTDRNVTLTSEKNDAESTAFRIVYDVTVTFTYEISYNNSNKLDESKVIVITYKRYYNVPDNFQTVIEHIDYVADFTDNNYTKVTTVTQYNELKTTVTNNGVVVSTDTRRRDLNLEGEMTGSDEVSISAVPTTAPTVSVVSRPNSTSWNNDRDNQGFQSKRTSETRSINLSDGAKFELSYFFDKDTRNGADTLDHTKIKGVRSATASVPVKVESLSTATREVYSVELTVVLDLESTQQVQTKAASDNTLTLKTTYNEVRTIEVKDEYVPGQDRTVWNVTPNGNGFDIVGEQYETWTISGEILTDTKSGRMSASNTGRNGGSHVVSNFNFVNNGQGHNGTGNGMYTSPASNGTETINSLYDWSADATLTLTLKGKGGNGASKTFVGEFVMNEAGQNIGASSIVNGYDVCTLVNNTNAVYTVEGQSINLPASVNHELKVKRNVPNIFPDEWGKCLGAGVSAVPAHWVASADMYQDGNGTQQAIKTMTFRFENGAVTVPFAGADDTSVAMPEISKVLSGNFVTGQYDASYNSGYYTGGQWVPAIAVDRNGGISYSIPGHNGIRSIRQETLNQWNWRNKNYSTVVSGYTFNCTEDGQLTVIFNGNVVFEGR